MKRTLIIGNTLLFAACLSGCDDDPVAAAGDQTVTADGAVDQSPMDDMAQADMSMEADMSVEADMMVMADMSLDPDMAQADMAEPDMAQADMAELDMAEPDMAEPDMAEPDMAEPDMAEPDMMLEPDMAADPCAALIGQPCRQAFQEGCCDSNNNATVICDGATFRAAGPEDFCNCFGEAMEPPQEIACAVPGFVGVHASGWRPARVVRLRRVA